MTHRDAAPIGAPCWIELFSSDTDKAEAFYGSLFGWTFESAGPEYGGYINASKDAQRVAGVMDNDESSGQPDGWGVYLATDDATKTVEAATANGGQVIVPPMQVHALGTMVVLLDNAGTSIGAWQPGEHKGFQVFDEPGTPSWFELHTRDYEKVVDFYRDVFRFDAHTMSDDPEFRYTTYGEGETSLAGIMDGTGMLPDGIPGRWSVYFSVENSDAALEQIGKLGGQTVTPGHDTPWGRLAIATDPTGAEFKLRGLS